MSSRWRRIGPLLGLLLVSALFAVWLPDRFLQFYNLQVIAMQTVFVALVALGMTFVVVAGGIDLSVGSVVALVSVVAALLAKAGLPATVVLVLATLAGALAGAVNGALVLALRVPFLVTLGTMGAARGLAKALADEQKVDADPGGLMQLVDKVPEPEWLLFAPAVWLTLLVALVAAFLLRATTFGLRVFAVGSSEANARLCGVPVAATKVLVYVLCGALAGLVGGLWFARLSVGDPTAATGFELQVIAAVVIGGASLSGGVGSIAGTMAGALMMVVLQNGCTLANRPAYEQDIAVGLIIVAALALDQIGRRRGVAT